MFEQIYRKMISTLEDKLPPWLYYHSPDHTKYVLEQAVFLAEKEKVTGRNLFLLKIAALYHDAGFIVGQENHEDLGCEIASKELPEYGLSPLEIKKICGMITATNIPQQPKNQLERILADADLEYLGTDNFTAISQDLYKELLHYRPGLTKSKWNEIQVNFLSNHQYHTNYCRKYREPKKRENLEMVKRELEKNY